MQWSLRSGRSSYGTDTLSANPPTGPFGKCDSMRTIRLILYVIELVVFWPILLLLPLGTMGHSRPGQFAGYPIAFGVAIAGTICIIAGLKQSRGTIAAFLFRFAGLCLHAMAGPALCDIDGGTLLSPANWSKWHSGLVVCESVFLAFTAVDLWLTRRIIRQLPQSETQETSIPQV